MAFVWLRHYVIRKWQTASLKGDPLPLQPESATDGQILLLRLVICNFSRESSARPPSLCLDSIIFFVLRQEHKLAERKCSLFIFSVLDKSSRAFQSGLDGGLFFIYFMFCLVFSPSLTVRKFLLQSHDQLVTISTTFNRFKRLKITSRHLNTCGHVLDFINLFFFKIIVD